MSKRADRKKRDCSINPPRWISINIFSNIRLKIDGKSVLLIVAALILAALVVSEFESDALQSFKSVFEALLGA